VLPIYQDSWYNSILGSTLHDYQRGFPVAEQVAREFVSFCLGRLSSDSDWGHLYDEMCHVAARGLFRGWGYLELSSHGVSLSLINLHPLRELHASLCAPRHVRRNGNGDSL